MWTFFFATSALLPNAGSRTKYLTNSNKSAMDDEIEYIPVPRKILRQLASNVSSLSMISSLNPSGNNEWAYLAGAIEAAAKSVALDAELLNIGGGSSYHSSSPQFSTRSSSPTLHALSSRASSMAPDGPNIQSDDDMDVPLIDVDINDLDERDGGPPTLPHLTQSSLYNSKYLSTNTPHCTNSSFLILRRF
jgi:hypothetical protein